MAFRSPRDNELTQPYGVGDALVTRQMPTSEAMCSSFWDGHIIMLPDKKTKQCETNWKKDNQHELVWMYKLCI